MAGPVQLAGVSRLGSFGPSKWGRTRSSVYGPTCSESFAEASGRFQDDCKVWTGPTVRHLESQVAEPISVSIRPRRSRSGAVALFNLMVRKKCAPLCPKVSPAGYSLCIRGSPNQSLGSSSEGNPGAEPVATSVLPFSRGRRDNMVDACEPIKGRPLSCRVRGRSFEFLPGAPSSKAVVLAAASC